MSKNEKPWVMPKWMKPLERFINNTGGNEIEELVNDHETTVQVNAPRAMVCVAVKAQVLLLQTLASKNMIAHPGKKKGLLFEKDWFELAVECIANKLPEDHGFAMFGFPIGKVGNMHYLSNAQKQDVVRMLKSWIVEQEAKE